MIRKTKWSIWNDDLKNILEKNAINNDDDEDYECECQRPRMQAGMAIDTPMGMLPIPITNIQFVSDKIEFHILETNFDITHDILQSISVVPGVVSVEPITRYSVRIGMPKSELFENGNTQTAVNNAITHYFNKEQDLILQSLEPNTRQKVAEVRDYLNKRNDCWTLLILPNGNMEVVTAEHIDSPDYQKKQQLFVQTHQLVGGKILTSEPVNG